MLSHLKIREFAIVKHLEVDFQAGFSVITGETGAGKSILMDALGLCLGDRADSSMVKQGAERADISAGFDLSHQPNAAAWLKERELDAGGDCWLRRTVNPDGRSRAWINGNPVTLADIKSLGELLIDIHSQHEHQSLLRKDNHRQLLDASAHLQPLANDVSQHFHQWQKVVRQLQKSQAESSSLLEQKYTLEQKLADLQTFKLQPDEYTVLEKEHDALANINGLLSQGELALSILQDNENDNVLRLLQQALKALESERQHHPTLQESCTLLEEAIIQSKEAYNSLQHYLQQTEANPERLHYLEERLSDLHQLARKYRCPVQELFQLQQETEESLLALNQHHDLAALEQLVKSHEAHYQTLAQELAKQRQATAEFFQKNVLARLRSLGMPDSDFVVNFSPLEKPSAHGIQDIEFLICTNPGSGLKSLQKVASGGELSRISLAIQVVNAKTTAVPAMVFDEVDVGIGGGIAEVVGRLLRELGQHAQVFSITHQPQVAALGHTHWRVEKHAENGVVESRVRQLSHAERVEEIARMSGGMNISDETRRHAEAMLLMADTKIIIDA
jgi:DNA repair protein RecN (Recombination protein N)